jgi:hypothetical protein
MTREETRLHDLEERIGRSTTSYLEHQRDTYYEMVADRLDSDGKKFLETLMLIDREIIARELANNYVQR